MEQSKFEARKVLKWGLLCLLLTFFLSCVPKEELPVEKDDETETVIPEPEKPDVPEVGGPPDTERVDYLYASDINTSLVDRYFSSTQLIKTRSLLNVDQVDKCNATKNIYANDNFGDQIHYYTELMLDRVPAQVGVIGSYYGAPSNDSSYHQVSLMSHPLCTVTASSLGTTLKKVPTASVITKLNNFTNKMNSLRTKALAGDSTAKEELIEGWGKLFSCLSYTESLSSADSASSKSVASANAPAGYSRPSGVEFYNDPAQNEASRLNIGLFQFTPNSTGNIKPCLLAWNAIHENQASCKVNASGSKADMIKILGSSYQSFNAFCGVHKLIQTFSIQVNTTGSSATFPGNVGKTAANRCVSPHFYAGKAYNHFGPLQNSTGSNMNKLYACIEGA